MPGLTDARMRASGKDLHVFVNNLTLRGGEMPPPLVYLFPPALQIQCGAKAQGFCV